MSPLDQVQAFCEWQTRRLRLSINRPAAPATVPDATSQTSPDRYRARRPRRLRRITPRGPYLAEQPHGTVARYNHDKCRCQSCVDAKRAYYHEYHYGPQR